jgi:hypothetical protein
MRAAAGRVLHHEYWPTWVFYLPVYPYAAWLSLRHGGVMAFSCCNPGIPAGGGIVGESKHDIMRRLGTSPAVLPTGLIAPGDVETRLRSLREFMGAHAVTFPVVLKPDAGQRGMGVRVIDGERKAREYLADMTAPAVAQPFHPGPHECGVLWVRRLPGDGPGPLAGRIYAITRKEFPVVVGDGRTTLADLVRGHPRFSRQARVFLARLGPRGGAVPAAGERVRLGHAGNHCQGTLFRDGADLLTPALESAIDALAAGFDGGLDVGRMDLRYESDEALRRGEGFAVLELNGTTSEATNMYDPDRSLLWAWSVLLGLWKRMYALGAWRRGLGVRPVTVGEVWRQWRAFSRGRRGGEVSD